MTASDQLAAFAHGPVAGLGFDMSNPIVFAGWSAVYRQNLSFNLIVTQLVLA